jgi:hypothetical protein
MFERKYLDRNRGLQAGDFKDAIERSIADYDNDDSCEGIPKTPGTDIADRYGTSVKPDGVPVWDAPPVSPEEEAIYFGNHIHSESNPLGLHSHIKGGTPSGGHTHGPQNRTGAHHHKQEVARYGITLDGSHAHDGYNYPDGPHTHCPENFG